MDGPTPRASRASPALHVVVRRTLDWADEASVEAGLVPTFRAKYDAWNSFFAMRYAEFRRRLHEIARASWSRVEGAVVVALEDVPPGAPFAPVDDDDWFAPDLAARVGEAHDPDVRGWRWTCHVLEPVRRRRPWLGGLLGPRRPTRHAVVAPAFLCETNGYALANEPSWRDLRTRHSEASARFAAEPGRVRHLARVLAIQNKSLASQTVLDYRSPTVSPDFLRRRLRRYRRFYRPSALPPGAEWARPHVEAMADLMDDLRPA
jgi:hypothetical protein